MRRRLLDAVYEGAHDPAAHEGALAPADLAEPEGRVLTGSARPVFSSPSAVTDLVAIATSRGCIDRTHPAGGATSCRWAISARGSIRPRRWSTRRPSISVVAFGPERTMRQDPLFAFRIMVDIAARALSPAVNDPTTAVLALDQIHRLLRHAGLKKLDNARLSMMALVCSGWPIRRPIGKTSWRWRPRRDLPFLGLRSLQARPAPARHAGAPDCQAWPPQRAPALQRELDLLERSVARSFSRGGGSTPRQHRRPSGPGWLIAAPTPAGRITLGLGAARGDRRESIKQRPAGRRSPPSAPPSAAAVLRVAAST